MRQEDLAAIRNLGLFLGCNEATFEKLMEAGFLQRFPNGVELIHEGEPADFLYILVEGLVEMYAKAQDKSTTISFVRPISPFILAAVLRDQVYLQSARTLARSQVLMIPAVSVRLAMRDDVEFMAAIVAELALGYRNSIKELKNQKLRSGTERLANWILRTHASQGNSDEVTIFIEKRALASRLGMTPENLSRAFSTLRPFGVRVSGATVKLDDVPTLEQFANPSPLIDDFST